MRKYSVLSLAGLTLLGVALLSVAWEFVFEDLATSHLAFGRSETKWVELLRARAQVGNSEAQHRLSQFYSYRGEVEESVRWRCIAAHHGHPDAQFSLGRSYQYGDETVQLAPILAYMWLALSEANTDRAIRSVYREALASVYREALAKGMTREQIAEAEGLVVEWKPNPAECEMATQDIPSKPDVL